MNSKFDRPLNHDFRVRVKSNTRRLSRVWTRLTHQNLALWNRVSQSSTDSGPWISSAESPPYINGKPSASRFQRCIVRVPQTPFRPHFDSSAFHQVLYASGWGQSLQHSNNHTKSYRNEYEFISSLTWLIGQNSVYWNTLYERSLFSAAWFSSAESLPYLDGKVSSARFQRWRLKCSTVLY